MRFSVTTTTILLAVSGVSAGCFKRGNKVDGKWVGDGQYGKGLKEGDKLGAIANLLKGSYLADEDRTQCAMDTLGNKWRFYLKNTSGSKASIDYTKARQYISDEATACQFGGARTRDGWEVVSDPNPGECIDTPSPIWDVKRDDDKTAVPFSA